MLKCQNQNLFKFEIWLMAIRPKTLFAGIAPVLIGTAMAYKTGLHHWLSAAICLFIAISIQIATNFANDYYDFINGSDSDKRTGPTRVTQAGLIKPQTMKISYILLMIITGLLGLLLFKRAGWVILIITVISIASGILYTGGPYPLGYNGLGDIFVLIFFGPVALAGTYYVQTLTLDINIIIIGFGPGLISMAMLAVNNLRDVDEDRLSGKRTLAVIFGKTFAKWEFLVCIVLACLIPVYIFIACKPCKYSIMSSLILLPAIPVVKTIFTHTDGSALNESLANTGKLLILYSILFSIGSVI